MTRAEKIAVVEAYLTGLGKKDFTNVPFAPDVTYESPLTAKLTGQEAIAFLEGVFPVVKGVEIRQHIVEGEYVATVFDFDTVHGVIPVFDCFRVAGGMLKAIHPFYDPRPITEAGDRE